MKLHALVFAAHPDDAELSCSGTILSLLDSGKKVGIIDFTRGELGTRGTPEIRLKESENATKILGVHARENLGYRDGFFRNDEEHQLGLIRLIRKYQPEIIIANAVHDRHTDHGKGAELATTACFLSGLRKIVTNLDGKDQEPWRPKNVFHYIQDRYIKPDVVVDITQYWEKKVESIKAFKSQFFDPSSNEPESYISSPDFMNFIEARAKEMGHAIGVKYGEGFTLEKQVGVRDLFHLI
jgi:N-acetylglucosamine malate deacetylase 1